MLELFPFFSQCASCPIPHCLLRFLRGTIPAPLLSSEFLNSVIFPKLGFPIYPPPPHTHTETSERAQDKHSPGLLSKVSSARELVGNSTGLYSRRASVWVLSTDGASLLRYLGQADKLQGQSGTPVPKGSHPLLDQANIWMKKDTWV